MKEKTVDIQIDYVFHKLTVSEARRVYDQLDAFFSHNTVSQPIITLNNPEVPLDPWCQPISESDDY